LVQLREIDPELKSLGVQFIAISPDKPSKLKETIEKHKLGFGFLSDGDMTVARSFGVAYTLDDQTLAGLKKYGIDVEGASGQKHHMLPVPAVFLVAMNGLIQFEYVNPDYKVRLDPELLLCAAKIIFYYLQRVRLAEVCARTPGEFWVGMNRQLRGELEARNQRGI